MPNFQSMLSELKKNKCWFVVLASQIKTCLKIFGKTTKVIFCCAPLIQKTAYTQQLENPNRYEIVTNDQMSNVQIDLSEVKEHTVQSH